MAATLARPVLRVLQLMLALLALVYLLYFADHARQLLGFPYPLDYGEGPLLAQVERLLAGTPIWRLYADPAAPPYLIVNYPPLYLLLCAALAPLVGSTLLAGRLLSLLAAVGCVLAIASLAAVNEGQHKARRWPLWLVACAPALLLLAVPIVREWAALMRVDLLGVCVGLWGLVVLARRATITAGRAACAGLLLAACLFTKPSLIAAPAAAGLWLLWRVWRAPPSERRSALTALLACGAAGAVCGGLGFALLQWASDGWFALHVVAANANRWELGLALGFWGQQLQLRWALGVAAALALVGLSTTTKDLLATKPQSAQSKLQTRSVSVSSVALWQYANPLGMLYTLVGALAALGVGKVGAYSNYFLELYAGLIWLVAAAIGRWHSHQGATPRWIEPTTYLLLVLSLLYYPPLWDADRLRPAGLLAASPPRLALGSYGLWADARREAALLAAQTRVGAALSAEVRAAGPIILTDQPGVAAAAGVGSRLQAFEARQLLDQGLADEHELRVALANGALPLAVIDYLGNWLSPEVVTLLQRRYAQDGALGTNDLFRPVELGPAQALDLDFATPAGRLHLEALLLAPPLGNAYEPGELLPLGLAWRRVGEPMPNAGAELSVIVQLKSLAGAVLLQQERPLLYGALPPETWPTDTALQHVQPIELPPELPPGDYLLAAGLRIGANAPQIETVAQLAVAAQGGAFVAETGYFVPAPLRRAWAELGGTERAGYPLTPAVPFAWGRLQCFERACLELRAGVAQLRPLGEQLYLAETIRGEACAEGAPRVEDGLCSGFAGAAERYSSLGPALSGELRRSGWLVQWTAEARLERQPGEAVNGLGRLGDESLRLPPGTRYRWP